MESEIAYKERLISWLVYVWCFDDNPIASGKRLIPLIKIVHTTLHILE